MLHRLVFFQFNGLWIGFADKRNDLVQAICKFVKILFVEKKFVFFIEKLSIAVKSFFTLGNCQVVVIPPGSFYIKKVGPFPGPYSLGMDLFPSCSICSILIRFNISFINQYVSFG